MITYKEINPLVMRVQFKYCNWKNECHAATKRNEGDPDKLYHWNDILKKHPVCPICGRQLEIERIYVVEDK